MSQKITVQAMVKAPLSTVWEAWTQPQHITKWNFASPDWECPSAENDLVVGGKFTMRMAAKDGSVGFDFSGIYTNVVEESLIEYAMSDGREVQVIFEVVDGVVMVKEVFDAESENPPEMQKAGWQAILDNFAKYVQALS